MFRSNFSTIIAKYENMQSSVSIELPRRLFAGFLEVP